MVALPHCYMDLCRTNGLCSFFLCEHARTNDAGMNEHGAWQQLFAEEPTHCGWLLSRESERWEGPPP